jgi:fatty acyl-CoA reductase
LFGLSPCRAVKDALDSLQYNYVVNYFGVNGWKHHDKNVRCLLAKLSPEDRDIFSFDVKQFSWNEYLESCVKGVRQYILKDDLSTLPQARKRYKT